MLANQLNEWSPEQGERRALPRYRFYGHVEMVLPSKVRWGRVRDVSGAGMFIETGECLAVNTCFQASLALETPLPMECVVRRVVPGRGIGVSISFLQEDARRRFTALLIALGSETDSSAAGATIPMAASATACQAAR